MISRCAVTLFTLSFVLVFICLPARAAEETKTCKSLDIREFGLVGDGEIGESWSEAELLENYGPPCQIIDLGDVFIERERGRIREVTPQTFEQEKEKQGTIAIKKQYIYKGDWSNRTSVFTIIDGMVVKKERIF